MGLREVIPKGFYLGCSEQVSILKTDELLQEIAVNNFNLITPQNSLKLGVVAKNPDSFNFEESDWLVDFATKHNLEIRGHLMLWARSIPDWTRGMEGYQFKATVKNYIVETLRRYPQIKIWDICGESFDDRGNPRDTILSASIGDDWIQQSLLWAKEVRPDAKLFYSEFSLHRPLKQQAVLNLIESCDSMDIPLDGIGIQLHHNLAGIFKLFRLKNFIKKIQSRGIDTHFSEITIWGQTSINGNFSQFSHGIAYSELLRLAGDCGINTFNLWGITDRYAWRCPEREPFLFDVDYQPKQAYHAILNALSQSKGIAG